MDVVATLFNPRHGKRERLDLTTTHVCHNIKRWGVDEHTAIPLHLITSLHFTFSSTIGCLLLSLLAGASACTALVLRSMEGFETGWTRVAWAAGAVFIVLGGLFLVSRRRIIEIFSPTECIRMRLYGDNREEARRFVERIERQQLLFMQGAVEARVTAPPLPLTATAVQSPPPRERPKIEWQEPEPEPEATKEAEDDGLAEE